MEEPVLLAVICEVGHCDKKQDCHQLEEQSGLCSGSRVVCDML